MSKMVELDWNPSVRTLRQFGYVALAGFGGLSVAAWTERFVFSFGLGAGRTAVAGSLAALAVLCLLFSWVYPRGNRPFFVGLGLLTYPIGFVLSYAIMGTLYFAVIAPLAVFFRLVGRDSLHRQYDPAAASYWSMPRPTRPKSDYFKQY